MAERDIVPVAEVKCGRLRWHIASPTSAVEPRFLNNDTHPLYDQAVIDALRTRIAALEADAARWRWLRQCGGWPDTEAGVSGNTPEQFDAMADAAMQPPTEDAKGGA